MRYNKTTIILLLILMFELTLGQNNSQIEKALLDFHNQNLSCVNDYTVNVKYPTSPEIYFAWTNLALAASKDAAIVMSVGQSEVVIKVIDGAGTVVDVVDIGNQLTKADASDVAGKVIVSKLKDKVIEQLEKDLANKVWKKGTKHIPFVRTGVEIASVYNTYSTEEAKINRSILQQKDLIEAQFEVLEEYKNIKTQINSLTSDSDKEYYNDVLNKMISKKAEVNVRNSMLSGSGDDIASNLIKSIYEEITGPMNETSAGFSNDIRVAVEDYLSGDISDAEFSMAVKKNIEDQINSINKFRQKNSNVNSILNSLKPLLRKIKEQREALNMYSCGSSFVKNKINSIEELEKITDSKRYSRDNVSRNVTSPIQSSTTQIVTSTGGMLTSGLILGGALVGGIGLYTILAQKNENNKTNNDPGGIGGLSDVTVNSKYISLTVYDHGQVDGDRIDLIVNGVYILRDYTLVGYPGKTVNVTLKSGTNDVVVHALNEGTVPPNTATVEISNVTKGNPAQKWEINIGSNASFKIYFSGLSKEDPFKIQQVGFGGVATINKSTNLKLYYSNEEKIGENLQLNLLYNLSKQLSFEIGFNQIKYGKDIRNNSSFDINLISAEIVDGVRLSFSNHSELSKQNRRSDWSNESMIVGYYSKMLSDNFLLSSSVKTNLMHSSNNFNSYEIIPSIRGDYFWGKHFSIYLSTQIHSFDDTYSNKFHTSEGWINLGCNLSQKWFELSSSLFSTLDNRQVTILNNNLSFSIIKGLKYCGSYSINITQPQFSIYYHSLKWGYLSIVYIRPFSSFGVQFNL